mgnify:CR=1 FL=1
MMNSFVKLIFWFCNLVLLLMFWLVFFLFIIYLILYIILIVIGSEVPFVAANINKVIFKKGWHGIVF